MEHELVAADREPQVVLDREPAVGRLVHRLGEELVAVPPAVLDVVHRDVRVLHQHVGVAAVVGVERDAGARREVELATLDEVRRAELAEQVLRDDARVARVAHLLQHDDELVAAESRDGVAGAQRARQPRRHLLQDLVADVVAERVVDVLESIEVEEHQRHAGAMPAREHERLAQPVGEQVAVGEPGQAVVVREPHELRFRAAPLGCLQGERDHGRNPGGEVDLLRLPGARAPRHFAAHHAHHPAVEPDRRVERRGDPERLQIDRPQRPRRRVTRRVLRGDDLVRHDRGEIRRMVGGVERVDGRRRVGRAVGTVHDLAADRRPVGEHPPVARAVEAQRRAGGRQHLLQRGAEVGAVAAREREELVAVIEQALAAHAQLLLGEAAFGDLALELDVLRRQVARALADAALELLAAADERLLRRVLRGHVLHDPDRSLRDIGRIDRPPRDMAEDRRAVAAPQRHLGLVGLAPLDDRERSARNVPGASSLGYSIAVPRPTSSPGAYPNSSSTLRLQRISMRLRE